MHPVKALEVLDDSGLCIPYGKSIEYTNEVTPKSRGLYKKSYHRANIITFRASNISLYNSLTGLRCLPHIISQDRAIDIDSEVDFLCIEALMRKFHWRKITLDSSPFTP